MTFVSRCLIIVAAVFLAVNPAMACCFVDSSHAAPIVIETSPPCHGEQATNFEDSGDGEEESKDCLTSTACADFKIESILATDTVSVVAEKTDQMVILADEEHHLEITAYCMSTGPPAGQVTHVDTPLTLKQRLLI